MARIGSSLGAPAPAPDPSDGTLGSIGDVFQMLIIILSVLVTTTLLFFLFFLGRIRRSVHPGPLLKYTTKIFYIFVPIAITYIMGLMHKAEHQHDWYPVWAGALVYAYGGVVTMTAFNLKDNDDTLRFVLHTLPLFFWTLWLGYLSFVDLSTSKTWMCAFVFFLVLALTNARQTLLAHYMASKSKGLPRLVEPIVRYMEDGCDVVSNLDEANPRLMRGYRYVVWGNPNHNNDKLTYITTEDIWKWVPTTEEQEEILQSLTLTQQQQQQQQASSSQLRIKLPENWCASKERLRDLCLSYALYRLMLRRFAGFDLHESSKQSTRRFVLEGLLCRREPRKLDVQRVFRLIEVELDFLFDLFYTKSHVCSSYRFRDVLLQLVHIGLLWFFAIVGIGLIAKEIGLDSDYMWGTGLSNGQVNNATRVVVILFVLLESWKFMMANYSNRKMVWLLCTSLHETSTSNICALITKYRIILIWTIKDYLSRSYLLLFLNKPWQRRLGQYSFLKSYSRVPLLARKPFSPLNKLVKLPRIGQKGDFSVSLSTQVKQAIVSSLLQNELKLSRGTSTFARLTDINIRDHCVGTDAHVVLVWHIATTFCEYLNPPQNTHGQDHDHFLVATQLSKYCAYLLTFSPELIPGHPYITERLFDEAVQQAKRLDLGCMNIPQRFQYLILETDNDAIVVKGALLARTLIEGVINNPQRGWNVLAEFWAELLLYLAPSDNVAVHGEYLARGGEFITHLWALLTHAGVLTRPQSSLVTI